MSYPIFLLISWVAGSVAVAVEPKRSDELAAFVSCFFIWPLFAVLSPVLLMAKLIRRVGC